MHTPEFKGEIISATAKSGLISHRGFTLLELMVVIAIIGLLAAVAIPSYRRNLVTTAIEEGLIFADEERIKVELFYDVEGRMPASEPNFASGLPVDKVQQIRWTHNNDQSGHLTVVMDLSEFDLRRYAFAFILTAQADTSGRISWACRPSTGTNLDVPPQYLPSTCQ